MFNLTDLKQLDPTQLDLTRFDVGNIEMPSLGDIRLPSIDVRGFELPGIELPGIDLDDLDPRDFELPEHATRVAEFARDAAYAGVGAVVLTAEQADDRFRRLGDQVTTQVRRLVGSIS